MLTKRILVPVGRGGEAGVAGVVRAVALDQGSTVRLLRVLDVPGRVVGTDGRTVAFVDQEMERLTAKGLRELREAEARLEGVPVESVVRFGEPVEEILLEAEAFDADLIAVTTHARGRLAGALLAGVGERVVREAPVPVLALRD